MRTAWQGACPPPPARTLEGRQGEPGRCQLGGAATWWGNQAPAWVGGVPERSWWPLERGHGPEDRPGRGGQGWAGSVPRSGPTTPGPLPGGPAGLRRAQSGARPRSGQVRTRPPCRAHLAGGVGAPRARSRLPRDPRTLGKRRPGVGVPPDPGRAGARQRAPLGEETCGAPTCKVRPGAPRGSPQTQGRPQSRPYPRRAPGCSRARAAAAPWPAPARPRRRRALARSPARSSLGLHGAGLGCSSPRRGAGRRRGSRSGSRAGLRPPPRRAPRALPRAPPGARARRDPAGRAKAQRRKGARGAPGRTLGKLRPASGKGGDPPGRVGSVSLGVGPGCSPPCTPTAPWWAALLSPH